MPLVLPGNELGLGLPPVTFIVNCDAVAVPPLSLTTRLITISRGLSVFVSVQVFVSPTLSVTVPEVEHAPENPANV